MKRSLAANMIIVAGAILALAGPVAAADQAATSPELTELANDVRGHAKIDAETARAILFGKMNPQVKLTHVPANPKDGMFDSEKIIAGSARENDAARRVMADFKFTMTSIETHGDEIHMGTLSTGTMPDGRKVRLDVMSIFKVENGKVTAVTLKLSDLAEAAKFIEVIKMGAEKLEEATK